MHGNIRSWIARKIISAERKVVYPKRRYERILAVKRKVLPPTWPHTIDLYNEAVKKLGAKVYCKRPFLKISERELDKPVEHIIKKHERYVVIAPGATHPNKQWHIERFAEVAVNLHRAEQVGIVWAVTGADTKKASPVNEIEATSFVGLVDYPVEKLINVISKAVLTIANDSGVAHISSSVGTPVIALFGPTHPTLGFAPRGLHDRIIEVEEPCRPCSLHGNKKCYRSERYCFNRIGAEMVTEAALKTIKADVKNRAAVLVDRDGTIIVDKYFLSNPDEIEFEHGSVEALRMIQESAYKIVIVSNQSGVARGTFDIESVEKVNSRLMELLAREHIYIDALYYCPHHPRGNLNTYTMECDCRKPAAGMAEQAAYQVGIDLRKSCVIGDKAEDVILSKVIGADSLMVRTGHGEKQQDIIDPDGFYRNVKIVDNLLAAAVYLKELKSHD